MKLSEKLQKLRKENNITQEGLADRLNVSRQAVSKWESGTAYPDTEKLIQISKIFNVSLDELINDNENMNNSNSRDKISFMDIFNEMLDFISKSVNMFWSMKFFEKIKCLFEMGILILIIVGIAVLSSSMIVDLVRRILIFLPDNFIYLVCNLFDLLLFLAWLVLGIIIVIRIFKMRYLDYYVFVTDDSVTEKTFEEPIKELKEKKEYKVVIRDPRDSSLNILKNIGRVFTNLSKCFCFLFAVPLVILFIFCMMMLVFSVFYLSSGLFFNGISISIIGIILFVYLMIEFIYNLVFNRKHAVNRIFILFIISVSLVGVGLGLSFTSLSSFTYEKNKSSEVVKHEIEMSDNLVLDFMRYEIDNVIIDNNISNIKLEISAYKGYDVYLYNYSSYDSDMNTYMVYDIGYDYNDIEIYKDIINGLKNKKIVNYDGDMYDVRIYMSLDNFTKLKENMNDFSGYIVYE